VARWEEEMQFTAEQQETMRNFRQAGANPQWPTLSGQPLQPG
jgi:hypothetical protein